MTIRKHVEEQMALIERDRLLPDGVNAVLEINPDALSFAEQLGRVPTGQRGSLHGMTLLLKDNINTGDRMHTSAGTLALAEHRAAEDAYIVRRLCMAGAVILGKGNMTELAHFMSFDMPPGYSARGGYVKNPHNRAENPSGSSSGCAAGVAAGFCDGAIGTETAGSIISPSQACGVVGIKPTAGLVSRTGIIPISFTLDTAGPIAANVRDTAKILSVLAGYDPEDTATDVLNCRAVPDYSGALDAARLKGARIGVNRGVAPSAAYKPHAERFLRFLKDRGAQLVDIEPIPNQMQILDIMNGEFKAAINKYLATAGRNAAVRSLSDIVSYNLAHPEAAQRYGQEQLVFALNETSGLMHERVYLEAMESRMAMRKKLSDIYGKNRLDVIVETAGWNTVGPLCGFPTGTVPIGWYNNNVPVGCLLMCRPYDDSSLLSLLYAIEKVLANKSIKARQRINM